MIKKYFFSFLLIIFFSNESSAQEKVVFLDINYILNNSIAGKQILSQLEEINNKNLSVLKKKETDLSKMENNIRKKKNVVSEAELNKEIISFEKKVQEFRFEKNDLVENFNKHKSEQILRFVNLINPIIKKYMNDNNIGLLLDKKNVFIAKSNYDITNILLEIINKEIKTFSIE